MTRSTWTTALLAALVAAGAAGCTASGTPTPDGSTTSQQVTQPEVPIACTPQPDSEALDERASPYDSTRIVIGDRTAQICYSRPGAKGRTIFGALVPYNRLWRTGANEPTILHLPFAADIAGISLEPGSYSIYTSPGENEWTLIINRSTSQWGHESQYKPDIQAQEVGRAQVPSERLTDHVESFTIRSEPSGTDGAVVVLEWERTRIRVPIRAVGS
jgi:hypothetical protein